MPLLLLFGLNGFKHELMASQTNNIDYFLAGYWLDIDYFQYPSE
jgi:hypothetical protein